MNQPVFTPRRKRNGVINYHEDPGCPPLKDGFRIRTLYVARDYMGLQPCPDCTHTTNDYVIIGE